MRKSDTSKITGMFVGVNFSKQDPFGTAKKRGTSVRLQDTKHTADSPVTRQ
jgi:hypothetical protein